jgi:hypothetical protein
MTPRPTAETPGKPPTNIRDREQNEPDQSRVRLKTADLPFFFLSEAVSEIGQ